ncbi:alpha-tocopherol transfer protein-like [Trichonephila clavipes]|nr:alpha-tocopherol transfer protein-like [Trichonephila clavipes]
MSSFLVLCEGNTRNRWRDGQVCPDVDKELWRLGPDGSGVFWRVMRKSDEGGQERLLEKKKEGRERRTSRVRERERTEGEDGKGEGKRVGKRDERSPPCSYKAVRDWSGKTMNAAKFKQIAKEELGETDEIRGQALEQFRKRILGDKKLKSPTDDEFLIQYLRARKFDVDKAMGLLHNYFKLVTAYPEVFDKLDKKKMDKLANCNLYNVHPLRDKDGCLVLTFKIRK